MGAETKEKKVFPVEKLRILFPVGAKITDKITELSDKTREGMVTNNQDGILDIEWREGDWQVIHGDE
ncbi:MAG: hypothetical protein GF390_04025, partial [Candidatus Pacebacteria bacterium]|nr:hypothetical protein [Candidatus Paceibacterota bacterium]